MTRKFHPHHFQRLLDPQRLQYNDPEQILSALALNPGQTFLDVGCGPGWFTIPAARLVGAQGLIYALDVATEMLSTLRQRLAEVPSGQGLALAPVQPLLVTEGAPWPLADGCCQRVLVANVFHEVDAMDMFLGELARVTHGEGLLLVADWRAEPTPMGPPMDHRLPTADVKAIFAAAGFQLVQEPPVGPYHYGLLLRPPATTAADRSG